MRTVGDLTANMIGRSHVHITHEGATVSGELRALDIETQTINDGTYAEPNRWQATEVHVTITLGSITIGPLERRHHCEVVE